MMVLVAYDVNTEKPEGRRRLRRVAKACEDWGQRVQNSVFECLVDPGRWAKLRARLVKEMDPAEDSLRCYYLGSKWEKRVEHLGAKPTYKPEGPLLL